MGRINYSRVLAGTVVAAAFYFVCDGMIHAVILGPEHMAAILAAGKPVTHDPTAYAYFVAFDVGKGLVAVLLYAAARPRFGAGVKTAIRVGFLAWFATEALPRIAAMPMPFYEKAFKWKWLGLELVPMVVGSVLGAWVYKEPATPA